MLVTSLIVPSRDSTRQASNAKFFSWLEARLRLTMNHQDDFLTPSEDQDDIADAELANRNAQRLIKLLPYVFSQRDEQYQETAMLFNNDLSFMNLIVDRQGRLTDIGDWECVSVLPLFRACQLLVVLISHERDEESQPSALGPPRVYDRDDESLDEGDMNDVYWEHCME